MSNLWHIFTYGVTKPATRPQQSGCLTESLMSDLGTMIEKKIQEDDTFAIVWMVLL